MPTARRRNKALAISAPANERPAVEKQTLESAAIVYLAAQSKPLDPLLLERLAEVGFLASEFGMHETAQRLFESLSRLRRNNPSPLVALAMVRARAGSLSEAMEQLRALIAQYPDCDLAKAMLGTMLVHGREPGALALFEQVIATDADPAAVSVSQSWIELAREYEAPRAALQIEPAEFFRYHNIRSSLRGDPQ
jgi:predicted Zn-dependent protease